MARYTGKWLLLPPSGHIQSETLFSDHTRPGKRNEWSSQSFPKLTQGLVLFLFVLCRRLMCLDGALGIWAHEGRVRKLQLNCEIFQLWTLAMTTGIDATFRGLVIIPIVWGPIPYAHYGSLCLPQISRLLMVLWEDIEWKSWIKSSGWFDQSYSKAQSALNCAPRS